MEIKQSTRINCELCGKVVWSYTQFCHDCLLERATQIGLFRDGVVHRPGEISGHTRREGAQQRPENR